MKILSDVAEGWLAAGISLPQTRFGTWPGENGIFADATWQRGLDNFFRQLTRENFHVAAGPGIRRRETARSICRRRPAEQKQNRAAIAQRAGVSGSHRGGQPPESGFDEHDFRPADALGAIREMRERRLLFAAIIRPFHLRAGPQDWARAWKSPNGAAGNLALENVLFAEADCVTATGSDETLAEIRTRLPAKVRFLGYGHRVSFGFVTRRSFAGASRSQGRGQRGG